MTYHQGTSVLSGPITRSRPWWSEGEFGEQDAAANTSLTVSPKPTNSGMSDRPIRHELVERIRREIANGTYESPEKWHAALQRLLQRLEGE
jgi:hypothetical protein